MNATLKSHAARIRTAKELAREKAHASGYFLSEDIVRSFPGLTPRMLQWWDELSILKPATKHGHMRQYTLQQAVLAAAAYQFRQKRHGLNPIKQFARRLSRHAVFPMYDQFLASDGATLTLLESEAAVIKYCLERNAVYVVSVGDQLKRLQQVKAAAQ